MRCVAFLRAINVGTHVVTMDRLRSLFVDMGYADAQTFLASGNVIFTARAPREADIEQKVSAALEAALGYGVPTFMRTREALAAVCAATPFPAQDMRDAVALNVGFLAATLGKDAIARMKSYDTDLDRFATIGREFYWMSRTRMSESPFFKVKFEKAFGVNVTFRTMSMLQRLAAKYPSRD
ncbi:MAG: DUF1697 domain-containing protein [Gemmatimonadaceae bacterium]|nr:DUF1697 domain-containing protein [Gemmatimonadaceae bacterium]